MESRAHEFGYYLAHTYSENTCETRYNNAKRFEEFLGEQGRNIEQIREDDPNTYLRWCIEARKYAPSTTQGLLINAKKYCDWLGLQGIKTPPFVIPRLPKIPKGKRRAIVPDDLIPSYNAACLQYTKEPMRSLLLLLPMCGLRVSEMCSLRIADVEIIPPSDNVPNGAAQVHVMHGKGDKYRSVPVLAEGLNVIVNYILNVRPEFTDKSKWLFPDIKKKGQHLERYKVKNAVNKVRLKLGWKSLHPHLLRHTYGTILNEAGVKAFDLALIMGHGDINITSTYIHPLKNRLLRQVSQLSYRGGDKIDV